MQMNFPDASSVEIDEMMEAAWKAFLVYRHTSLTDRSTFMYHVAANLEEDRQILVEKAMQETNLQKARLDGELTRTIFQLTSYADACVAGDWLEIRIDTAAPERKPPKPDIRKMMVPLGPVVVFGASNFPFAYSTAGGDTACAFAAGCPVVVKAHPGHAHTSELVANAIRKAASTCGLPEGVFGHIHGKSFETGKALVLHPRTKAVGFTGSFAGGKALFKWGNQRQEPIPVFAEMGSVNPVFLLPAKLEEDTEGIAKMLAASIVLSVGQFCTNPGVLVAVESPALDTFLNILAKEIQNVPAAKMLHEGIADQYQKNRDMMISNSNVTLISEGEKPVDKAGVATIATTTAADFLSDKELGREVFGPFSILVRCMDIHEMYQVAESIEGQLTATIFSTDAEIVSNRSLVDILNLKCGRFIFNGVPTGVEVVRAMHHGGPFPATTDSRFTSVGADGIKRFARPQCFQNWSEHLLPENLRNKNFNKIGRLINDEFSTTDL